MGVSGVAINRWQRGDQTPILPTNTVRCIHLSAFYLLDFCAKSRQVKRTVPVSSYYFGPPPADSAYFTPPVGQIGVHHPREIVRVERDYSGGEIVQFSSTYPLEFEGRVGLSHRPPFAFVSS
jgi:hypothetical protein